MALRFGKDSPSAHAEIRVVGPGQPLSPIDGSRDLSGCRLVHGLGDVTVDVGCDGQARMAEPLGHHLHRDAHLQPRGRVPVPERVQPYDRNARSLCSGGEHLRELLGVI